MVINNFKNVLSIFVLFFLFPNCGKSEIRDDLLFIKKNIISDDQKVVIDDETNTQNYFLTEQGEVKFLFLSLIFSYQTFLSSQDEPSCMFEPSCSQFTKLAIKKYGLTGILMGSDRIQRCNGFGYRYYKKNDNSLSIVDPIEKYHFRKASE